MLQNVSADGRCECQAKKIESARRHNVLLCNLADSSSQRWCVLHLYTTKTQKIPKAISFRSLVRLPVSFQKPGTLVWSVATSLEQKATAQQQRDPWSAQPQRHDSMTAWQHDSPTEDSWFWMIFMEFQTSKKSVLTEPAMIRYLPCSESKSKWCTTPKFFRLGLSAMQLRQYSLQQVAKLRSLFCFPTPWIC